MNRVGALLASGSDRRLYALVHLAAMTLVILVAAACGGRRHGGGGEAGFGLRGTVRTDFGAVASANALAIQADGSIVAAGLAGRDFALARYTHDGRLDRGFGRDGKVVTDFGVPQAYPRGAVAVYPRGAVAVAMQADGKIVAAGGSGSDFALARYTPAGRLDRSFGTGGKVLTDVGARAADALEASWKNGARAVAIQDDGRIVAAGEGDGVFALARYMPDGRLDAGFGAGGKIVTDFGSKVGSSAANDAAIANAVAVQADGKIIAAGRSVQDFAFTRYMPDGRLDASFGTGGKVLAKVGYGDFAYATAVALQTDGKIVAAGETFSPDSDDLVIVRLTPRGRLDRSFSSDGIAGGVGGAPTNAVAMQRDDKVVVIGNGALLHRPWAAAALRRYTRSGHPDQAFGNGGLVWIRYAAAFQATAVVIQDDSKIVVAGDDHASRSGSSDFLLVRYKPDGSLDR